MSNLIEKMNNLFVKEQPFGDFHKGIANAPQLPVIFIVGLPRSGTTPLAQMMVQRFRLGYVTNLIAKFWNSPELGIALTKELSSDPGAGESSLKSEYGFTAGYEGHHEFGYFWRRWFEFKYTHYLDQDAQSKVDVLGLQKSLSIMERAWERPLLFKNPAALPLQTAFLANTLPNSVFIYIKRELIPVAASLFKARQIYMGDVNKWSSIKPREYAFLKKQSLPAQIAGQIHYTQIEIERQLDAIPDQRKIYLSFSDLCKNPDCELNKISSFLRNHYSSIEQRTVKFSTLFPQPKRIDPEIKHQIEMCLSEFAGIES